MFKPFILSSFLLLLSIINLFSQNKAINLIGGTTTITIITKDTIWIAADSKRTQINETGKIIGHDTCLKISNTGNVFYTFSGDMVQISNAKGVILFDAYQIMNEALNKTKEFESGFVLFNKIAFHKLDSIFKVMPAKMLSGLKEKINEKQIESVMVSFINSEPKIINCDYGFIKEGDSTKFTFVKKNQGKNIPYLVLTGYSDEIHKAIDNTNYFGKETIKNDLIKLIKLEISSHGSVVGFPIYVLKLSKNSSDWYKCDN